MASIISNGREWLRKAVAASQGLRVDWVELSDDRLDGILNELPEMTPWPREAYALLLRERKNVVKRIALVSMKREPVGLIGLRLNRTAWEPVTQWILPHAVFPVREGYLFPCLAALGIPIRVACWRWETPPPKSSLIRSFTQGPRYGAKLSTDYQQYWKTSGRWNGLKTTRNRCKNFRLTVNEPGAVTWSIRSAEGQWRQPDTAEASNLEDRIEVFHFLESVGLHFTLTLLDGDKPIASQTYLADGKCLVGFTDYRDRAYDWYGVGTRLLDLSFQWAAESGFEEMDLGGIFEYKKLWAPENGWRGEFVAYHRALSILERLQGFALRLARKVSATPN